MTATPREGTRLKVDDPGHGKWCGVELPSLLVDGPIAGGDTDHPPAELCGNCKGKQVLTAAEIKRRAEACCQPVPEIDPAHIEDLSISHTGEQGTIYTYGICFQAYSRRFEVLDRDSDDIAEFAFSYGMEPEWCVDHDAVPADVIEHVMEILTPLSLEIDPHLVSEETDGDSQ
ncbi:hypothetical protein ACFQO4_05495 [Saliphagus sp. GCM10025334]